MFDPDRPSRGWALIWPRELLRTELTFLNTHWGQTKDLTVSVRWLFEEAFVGPDPDEDITVAVMSGDPWGVGRSDNGHVLGLLIEVLENLDHLPTYQRKEYYQQRHNPQPLTIPEHDTWRTLEGRLQRLLVNLDEHGYFDRRGGDRCTDGHPDALIEHNREMSELIADLCGQRVTWPITQHHVSDSMTHDEFFTLVEVLHDLVARPRGRWWHEYCDEHHYSEYDQNAGQAVYRWRINTLLDTYAPTFRISGEGEDIGQVVTTISDPRAALENVVRVDVPDDNGDPIDHAIALFRRRGATIVEKRSACVALAGVLESRRALLKEHLPNKDEGALFEIANKYRIRHHRADQHGDYAEEFLDWIFWNYLAAVELSNRLMARSPSRDHDDA